MQSKNGVLKLRATLIGFGFLWISLWAIAGSLMGYKINEEIVAGQIEWLSSLQRTLLRSTHAHMNTMALLSICAGLAAPFLSRELGEKLTVKLGLGLIVCIVVFGSGMALEVIFPPSQGHFSNGAIVTALGGSGFILINLIFGIASVRSVFSK
jgi:hypothetical protein